MSDKVINAAKAILKRKSPRRSRRIKEKKERIKSPLGRVQYSNNPYLNDLVKNICTDPKKFLNSNEVFLFFESL